MTEYEAVTLAQSLLSNASNMYVIFITFLSGYLLVAHLAGKSLTSSQLILIATLYMPTMIYTLYGWHSFTQLGAHYMAIANGLSEEASRGEQRLLYFGLFINLAITLAPLKYMYDIRRSNAP